jgi:hypothetical protein
MSQRISQIDKDREMEQLPFSFFPERRLYEDYPWQIWLIGWLAIFKAILWLASGPVLPESVLKILFYKYIIFMIPFLICGIGIWNLRKWAVKGIIILCCAELVFFIIYPGTLTYFAIDTTSLFSLLFTLIFTAVSFLIHGPISGIFILICSPVLFKYSGEYSHQ